MTLGQSSCFGSVRHVCFSSHVEVALSISSLLPGPYLSLEFLLELLHAGPALHCRLMLARQGLDGTFLSSPNLRSARRNCGFPLTPEPALCTSGLVCLSLGTLGLPAVLQRFVCFCQQPGPTLCTSRFVCSSLAPWPHVMCRWASVVLLGSLSLPSGRGQGL